MKNIIIVLLFSFTTLFAGLTKTSNPEYYSDADIFVDENNVRYSTVINLKFSSNIIELPLHQKTASISKVKNIVVANFLKNLNSKFGPIEIIKEVPSTAWGDTIRTNRRTGEKVFIRDLSQIFKIRTATVFNIDSMVFEFKKLPYIDYAEGPVEAVLAYSPNDPDFVGDNLWHLDKIVAANAWDITLGDPNIVVSINDYFTSDITSLHEELTNKVVYQDYTNRCGFHGLSVSGFCGAETDNGIGISSIGFKTSIDMSSWASTSKIQDAINRGVDVINFSWITSSSTTYRDVIHNALIQGIVCVAAIGNNKPNIGGDPPLIKYPAAHNFGADGQVIAVSATKMDGTNELFVDTWNYSPGTDPIGNPTSGFVDISCPGYDVKMLDYYTYNGYQYGRGTSFAAPQVSGLTALILSINNALTPQQVYEIITNSADKIGQYSYDSIGWNQYMGYGRINSFRALKYTLENYGGTINQDLTIDDTWNINAGVVIKIAAAHSITVNGTLNINGTSSNPVTFTRPTGTTTLWNGIQVYGNATIDHAIIEHAQKGVQFYAGSNGTVSNSDIRDNTYGVYIKDTTAPLVSNCQVYDNASYGFYVYNSNSSSNNLEIKNNTIHDNNYCGIHLSGSSPLITDNEIYNHTYGIIAVSNSSAYLGGYGTYGNNKVHNNNYGLAASVSNPFLGEETCTVHGGNNQFSSNTTNQIRAINNSYVQAELNWWGSNPPQSSKFYTSGGSSIDYTPWLTSIPGGSMMALGSPETKLFEHAFNNTESVGIEKSINYMDLFNPKWPLDRQLVFARDIMWLGDIESCQVICKDVIESFPDSSLSFFALDVLWQSSRKAVKAGAQDFESFKQYVHGLSVKKDKKDIYGYAELLSAGFETNKSVASASDNVYTPFKRTKSRG